MQALMSDNGYQRSIGENVKLKHSDDECLFLTTVPEVVTLVVEVSPWVLDNMEEVR